MTRRFSQRRGQVDFEERREKALRPDGRLGYDHHRLAIYFLDKEVFHLAESELRRCVWLNPYERMFQLDFGVCLYRQGKYREAHQVVEGLLAAWPNDPDGRHLAGLLAAHLTPTTGGGDGPA